MVLLTTSIILPMIQAAGIDLMWFGIYLVLVVEMSQVTPPVGFNLFVLQGTHRAQYPSDRPRGVPPSSSCCRSGSSCWWSSPKSRPTCRKQMTKN